MPEAAPVKQMRSVATGFLEEGEPEQAVEIVLEALQVTIVENARLALLIQRLKARAHGSSTDKVSAEQLSLLNILLGDALTEDEIDFKQDEDEADELDKEIEAQRQENEDKGKPKRTGKGSRPRNTSIHLDDLEVVHTHIEIPEDKKDWIKIGEDVVVRLRYTPGHYYREEIHVPVLRDPDWEPEKTDDSEEDAGGHIIKLTEQVQPTLRTRSLAGADVIAALIVQKYERHMPLHRMSRAAMTDQGLVLPVSTLSDWVGYGGDASISLMPALEKLMLSSWAIHTDATGIRVLDRKTNAYRGTITCYVGLGEPDKPPNICYKFTETGEGEHGVWAVLSEYQGYIIADACNIHDRLFSGKTAATEVGCNANGLKRFKDLKLEDPRSIYPMKLIQRAYRLETLADEMGLTPEQRTVFRQERTRPLFEEKLKPFLAKIIALDQPSSSLRGACQYYINHWDALTRFIDDGRLPLDNNLAESTLRPVRLGENNYLFIGSTEAGHRTAANMSLLATARAHGLSTMEYLTEAYETLARPVTAKTKRNLLPDRMAARKAEASSKE
jgi:hypothetical protein